MNFEFYHSKKDEVETEKWLRFLKEERDIKKMPDISCDYPKVLAWHNGITISFSRDGRAVGHLILEKYDPNTKETTIRHLPRFRYWGGNPEDKIVDKPIVCG